VTREKLRSRLWPQTTVDFDHGVNKAIGKIRYALGDSAGNPRFIETVARRGYRFLADVAVVGDRKTGSVPYEVGSIHSLAVLPLENLSNDTSQDYFADGMTEELITQLGRIRSLRVISRASVMTYKGGRKPLAEIARELRVDAAVEGSVLRFGGQVRMNAQLIAAPADRHIWARSYADNLCDTLALQSSVASAIAGQIRGTLDLGEQVALAKSKVVDPEAYEAYLKGRYFWNKRTGEGLEKAITYFNRAIKIHPNYAEAYSGLADSYALSGDWKYGVLPSLEAFAQAKAAAAKALALDDSLGEAHASLTLALVLYGWDWKAAETEYQRASERTPGYAPAHQWYSWHLIMMGRNSDGISELRKAESLDPLSLIISADIADALCVARRYNEAVLQSKKTLEMDASFAVGRFELGQALVQKQLYDQAIAQFQRAIKLSGRSGAFEANLAHLYGILGRKEEATKMLEGLKARYDKNPSIAAEIALIYFGLDDRDRAMMWLDMAYEARFKASILLHPVFDPLRSDARFMDLLDLSAFLEERPSGLQSPRDRRVSVELL
jgi:TolB-like protein/Flp pilus assembly protein TadD